MHFQVSFPDWDGIVLVEAFMQDSKPCYIRMRGLYLISQANTRMDSFKIAFTGSKSKMLFIQKGPWDLPDKELRVTSLHISSQSPFYNVHGDTLFRIVRVLHFHRISYWLCWKSSKKSYNCSRLRLKLSLSVLSLQFLHFSDIDGGNLSKFSL